MSSTIPAHADYHSGLRQKVDGMLRIRWTASTRFSGRHAPDSLVAMDRITHLTLGQTQQLKGVAIIEVLKRNKTNGNTEQVVHGNAVPVSVRIFWLEIGIYG
jgi:hypothetical protein